MPRSRGARQPRLRRQGLRACGWAAARSSSASMPSRCRTCLREFGGARRRHPGLPRLRRARRTSTRTIIAEAQRRPSISSTDLAEHLADPVALPQPRRRLRHPLHREGPDRSISTPSPPNLARARRRPDRRAVPRGERRSSSSAATSWGSAASTSRGCVDRKVSRGRTYLVVDGGMHHQLAASGNFGQAIRRNYPLVVGNRADVPRRTRAPRSSDACALRSICSATTSRCRPPTSTT